MRYNDTSSDLKTPSSWGTGFNRLLGRALVPYAISYRRYWKRSPRAQLTFWKAPCWPRNLPKHTPYNGYQGPRAPSIRYAGRVLSRQKRVIQNFNRPRKLDSGWIKSMVAFRQIHLLLDPTISDGRLAINLPQLYRRSPTYIWHPIPCLQTGKFKLEVTSLLENSGYSSTWVRTYRSFISRTNTFVTP